MRGYKVFNKNWTCRGFQYEVGKAYEMSEKPVCCNQGFHYCKDLKDCFSYYNFNPSNKVAIVEAFGDIDDEDGSKYCTNKIKIIKELSWEEVLRLVNIGKANSGFCNSGNRNSGDWNSGNRNSGNRNSGNMNSGNMNSGNRNSGDWNSGNRNSGNRNSGNRNSGNRNSGDWNIANYSNGCFNTEEPNIFLFNKISNITYIDWINSDVRYLLNNIPTDELIWIWESDMTDEEKENNPSYKTTGGYLKLVKVTNEDKQEWFDSLSNYDKQLILDIPNFDPSIFERITGIKTI